MRPPIQERPSTTKARKRAKGAPALSVGTLSRLGVAALASALVLMLGGVSDTLLSTNRVGATNPYDFQFTMGKPAGPTPWNPSTWDIATHIRDGYPGAGIEAMQAGHGANCAPAPATRAASDSSPS